MIPLDFILFAIGFIFVGSVFGFGAGVMFAMRTVATWDLDTLGQEESRCQ